ncbi:permease [Candidatus Magnetaquicoccus inordinatus]|uniref:permease n=1 Tax=Candidatus Magnetaquicoccus inordinatus TaxID=2496818 RepID=UPI00102CECD7|nr:permease [Candidatus Magnetaquicoccus inordinatus]
MSHSLGPPPTSLAPAREKWLGGLLLLLVILAIFLPALLQQQIGLPAYLDRLNQQPAPGWRENFATYFIAITLEGAPYMLLSALAGALLEWWIPAQWLPRMVNRLGVWGIPTIILFSPLFPICECGIGFVARRLLRLGLPLPHTIAYLLAAPILNPLVLAGTWMAFGQNLYYPLLRATGAVWVALLVALLLRRLPVEQQLITDVALAHSAASAAPAACCPATNHSSGWSRLRSVLLQSRADFLDSAGYFLFGVLIASLMKSLLNPAWLSAWGQGTISGPATMMLMAFTLSLCAGADAFVAASFITFSPLSHLAFLVIGPMLDIKLLFMYRTVFRGPFILRLALLIIFLVCAYIALLQSLPESWFDYLSDVDNRWQVLP